MSTTVTTQTELDTAITAGEDHIIINSPIGVWLELRSPSSSSVEARGSSSVVAWETSSVVAWGSSRVVARGSSSVVARGSSRVVAWGSSRVVAWETSSVVAWGSSSVVARGSSSVVAWETSSVVAWETSSVVAWGSSRVVARGSSSVVARGSSSVVAWGSSSVVAWGSSRVVARGSSSVVAWGSSRVVARETSRVVARETSSVVAWETSSVVAWAYVAVHLHSAEATISGGVVIDITAVDLTNPVTWASFHGLKAGEDGQFIVYKAVDQKLNAGQGYKLTAYPIGETVTSPDWDPTASCGRGLHFSASPSGARGHFNGVGVPRFLACSVPAGFTPLGDKLKAESCTVLREVTLWGETVEQVSEVKS